MLSGMRKRTAGASQSVAATRGVASTVRTTIPNVGAESSASQASGVRRGTQGITRVT